VRLIDWIGAVGFPEDILISLSQYGDFSYLPTWCQQLQLGWDQNNTESFLIKICIFAQCHMVQAQHTKHAGTHFNIKCDSDCPSISTEVEVFIN
jgi:hypothetical protein